MKLKGKLTLATLCALSMPITVLGVPVLDEPIEVSQPGDGSGNGLRFKIHPKGDEWSNWDETDDSYSVVRDSSTGRWHYAQKNAKGQLEASPAVVGRDNPAARGLRKHLRPTRTPQIPAQLAAGAESNAPVSAIDQAVTAPTTGQVPTLFILVKFLDKSNTYTAADFADFQTNQLRAYFNEASYGNLQTTPAVESHGTASDGVIGWLTLNQNHPDSRGSTGDQNRQLTAAAIVAADPYVNYGSYDTNLDGYLDSKELAVVVIPAGYETAYGGPSSAGAPSVWGHKWSLGWGAVAAPVVDGVYVGHYHNDQGGYAQFGEIHGYGTSSDHQATLGIMAHELGHLIMRWPDLYDTDYSSAGLGSWSLMAGGSWARKSDDSYSGQTPVHPDAWSKLYAGWVTPVSSTLGEFTLPAAGSASATSLNAVQIKTTSDPNQYFLFENRGQYGFDRGLYMIGAATGGIAVYHIDESVGGNNNELHKMVDLEEADNDTYSRPTNLFYYGNYTVFDGASGPGSQLYDGTATGIALNTVSLIKEQMTANFDDWQPVAPANDARDQALDVGEGQYPGVLADATPDGFANCPGNGQPDIWYRFTAPMAGVLRTDTCGSNDLGGTDAGTDTVLSLHSGDGLTELGCNDDWTNTGAPACPAGADAGLARDSAVQVSVVPDQQVLIRVTKYSSNDPAKNILLNVAFDPDSDEDGIVDSSDNCTLVANPTQIDSDGDGYGNSCDGDLNNNGFTNAQDYMLFQAQLSKPSVAPAYNPADLNGNGFVNAQDAVLLRQLLGQPSGPSGLVP